MNKISIAIHGGAGTILREQMTSEEELAYRTGLQMSLDAGYSVLEGNGSAISAVKAAVMILEDNPLFNAGKGSVFTHKGLHEMDAAIMNGENLEAGSVAGVTNVKNPIELAEQVMLFSGHVFLSGNGATDFARQQGLKMEPDAYFYTQSRFDQLNEIRDSDQYKLDHKREASAKTSKNKKLGTVGAVACDTYGNIAAATSTGGMTNKRYGRIGDSPIIGAGTYANNKTCAISCTGHGEPFIRSVVGYDISCLMEYKNMTLEEACKEVVLKKLIVIGGEGGLIGMDAKGNSVMVFNSEGMYRATKNSEGINLVAIYK